MAVEIKAQAVPPVYSTPEAMESVDVDRPVGCFAELVAKICSFIKKIFYILTCNLFKPSDIGQESGPQLRNEISPQKEKISHQPPLVQEAGDLVAEEEEWTVDKLPVLNLAQVEEKKADFLSSKNAEYYPPDLDQILKGGFFYLYDYLLARAKVGGRSQGIPMKVLEFEAPAFSRITIDVRHAIVSHVKELVKSSQQDVVFLVGNTGVGKSTTLALLRGDSLIRTEDDEYRTPVDTIIGESLESHTLLPNVYFTEERIYVDFPGFNDVRGDPLRLGIELAFKALVSFYKPKVILIASIHELEVEKANPLRDLGDALKRMLGRGDLCPVFITQYLQLSLFSKLDMAKQRKRELVQESQGRTKVNQQKTRKYEQKIAELSEEIRELEKEGGQASLKPREKKRLASDRQKVLQNRKKLESLCRGGDLRASELAACEELIQKTREKINKQNQELLHLLKIKNRNHPIAELAELEDPATREVCSAVINQAQPINAISRALPHSYKSALIKIFKEAFAGGLLPSPPLLVLDDLERQIMEGSLIGVLTAETCPEIGELLHLDEMDPRGFKEIDEAILAELRESLVRLVVENRGSKVPIASLITEGITSLSKSDRLRGAGLTRRWERLEDRLASTSKTGARTCQHLQSIYERQVEDVLRKIDEQSRRNLKRWDRWTARFFALLNLNEQPDVNQVTVEVVGRMIDSVNYSIDQLNKLEGWVSERDKKTPKSPPEKVVEL